MSGFKQHLPPILSTIGIFVLSLYASTESLGFADDAEFALTTYLGSTAHPPGFPAYVWIAWAFGKMTDLFVHSHVQSMVIFSSLCTGLMGYFLTRTFAEILPEGERVFTNGIVGMFATLSLSTGVTVWLWSNAVEVYAFHMLTMALTLFGLTFFHTQRKWIFLGVAALGIGLGLANHHLTMILFLPTVFLFLGKRLLLNEKNEAFLPHPQPPQEGKELFGSPLRVTSEGSDSEQFGSPLEGVGGEQVTFFKSLIYLGLGAGSIAALFYAIMFFRAHAHLPFEFGNPDSLGRFWNHLRGGYWASQTAVEVDGIMGLRFPYFLGLIVRQYLLFIPFLLVGIYVLISEKKLKLLGLILGYFFIILIYQLRIYQFADTDSYMLLPFIVGTILVAIGIHKAMSWKPAIYILAVVLIGQITLNFPQSNKRIYTISETLMADLDRSAPLNSVVLIEDWTMVSQYYYYRVAENFRPDLVVLKGNIKFTNHEMLKAMYPDFYEKIKSPYAAYIQAIKKHASGQEYDTGLDLSNPEIKSAYRSLISYIITDIASGNRPLLRDPGLFQLHYESGITTEYGLLSGVFFSFVDTQVPDEFIRLNIPWLDSPLLTHDPAAINTLSDYEILLEVYQNKFESTGDETPLKLARNSYRKIKSIQKEMVEVMPFIGGDGK